LVPSPPTPDQLDREADPDRLELADWLRARAHRIADRVRDLGEHATHTPPVWVAGLGDVPNDPVAREVWIRCAGHVAAYRERWQVPDTDPTLLPPCDRGEQGRARAWVSQYLAQHSIPEPQVDDHLAIRTMRVRNRLDMLKARMVQETTHAADAELSHNHGPAVETGVSADPDLDVGL
jgi:hypothetical protein